MSSKFHVMRKDGTELRSAGSLGSALDFMSNGHLLFIGTGAEAGIISKALARREQETKWESRGIVPGTLLAIAMEDTKDGND